MATKNRSNDLKTSLKTVRQINWIDGIHKLPNNVNKNLLDQCADIIQEFIENERSLPIEITKSKKAQVSKSKKQKIKNRKIKQPKLKQISKKIKISKNNPQPFNYSSAFPCFRSCGTINCPKNKLPMPRDLWYRIVYSQALEQQLGSGEAFIPQSQSSKRKHTEDDSLTDKSSYNHLHTNKSNSSNSRRRQQTMNATVSSTKIVALTIDDHLHTSGIEDHLEFQNTHKPFPNNLEYIAETLPLELENQTNQSKTILWNSNFDKTILFTQSAHTELVHHSKIHRGISADALLERDIPIPSAPPSPSIILNNQSNISTQQTTDMSPIDSSITFEHPSMNQLFEYYSLEDIPRLQLMKRLNRRLTHIHQTLNNMSLNDIEIKLKYKRDALVKKRQTPVQSLTKDERIAMVELELNVYEYVKALDEPLSKCFHDVSATLPILLSNDTVLPVINGAMISETSIAPSVSTFNTVQPTDIISRSTVVLSTTTQFTENTENFISWNHPLLSNLLNMFEPLTSIRKGQIQKQLARRCEHICKKAKQFTKTQLQLQIDSKTKALEQNKKILQPNENDRLRIAELELCLFELAKEQTQRNQFD